MIVDETFDVNAFLKLSPYNPVYYLYRDEVVKEVTSRVTKNLMTANQCEEFIKELHRKDPSRQSVEEISKATAIYERYFKDDGAIEYLKRDELEAVLETREVCQTFVNMSTSSSKRGPADIIPYFYSLARKMAENIQQKTDDEWKYFTKMKNLAFIVSARGILPRGGLDFVMPVLMLYLKKEVQLVKDFYKDQLLRDTGTIISTMKVFKDTGNDAQSIEKCLELFDNVPNYIQTIVNSGFDDAFALVRQDLKVLDFHYSRGGLSQAMYNLLGNYLKRNSFGIEEYKKHFGNNRLLSYTKLLMSNEEDIEFSAVFYTKEWMNTLNFCRDFLYYYSNEGLRRHCIEAALDYDFSITGKIDEIIEAQKEMLFKMLDLLLEYNVITMFEYDNYRQEGIDKYDKL